MPGLRINREFIDGLIVKPEYAKNYYDAYFDNNGELLIPVYKFKDKMGIWHQKELENCNNRELYSFGIACYNVLLAVDKGKFGEAKRSTLQVKQSRPKGLIALLIVLSVALVGLLWFIFYLSGVCTIFY